MKLFVYDHCPFCVRARMIFGLKNIPFELIALANDDEETPIKMVGQKMLPILQKDDGSYMPESLDIVHYVDQNYGENVILSSNRSEHIAAILNDLQQLDYILLYPRFIQLGLPEFTNQPAKDYFENKKSQRSGSFADCLNKTALVSEQVEALLTQLEKVLKSEQACNDELSIDDICLFPILRNLTCVKGLRFPAKVRLYIETMAKKSKINLYFANAI
ncbi:glutaredoxin 2 [Orbus sturtevantii]|uniref:glutaredoxin 2 n=1 Tax=Orbus sturtevantii TaxID=3074109 RepID=UPI00370D0785